MAQDEGCGECVGEKNVLSGVKAMHTTDNGDQGKKGFDAQY